MTESTPAAPSRPPAGPLPMFAWPPGTAVLAVAFVADPPPGHRLIAELPPPLHRRAVALPSGSGAAELELLTVPSESPEGGEWADRARGWVSEPTAAGVQTITFQGAVLVWGTGRVAVVAAAARLSALEAVSAELAFYERELHLVERRLAEWWPELEADAGPAFDFDEKSSRHRPRMAERYAQLLGLRARVSRLLPAVLTPHVYPPTLASQVSERLRERLRLRHRVEVLQDQLDVFERVYDTLGQRASDQRANRKGHTLEMVIIVLLAAQIVLAAFEVLTRAKG